MVKVKTSALCPACNTPLSRERWSEGLCPGCALELALEDSSLEAEVLADPEEAPTLQYSGHTFEEGQIQGERYRVRSLLGRGGMGEVWRAYDLKLRQDVALKALRTELIQNKEALETLRQEVRTAREVISPNVCRVFDLQEFGGQELVAMEYIDGTTLQEILKERSPLDLDEAREIASQFLAGVEAIHEAGLVHRDIKPENVMVTRTGRVVVMDFGIAKGLGDGKGGLVAGTPAYMSPEQSQGEELDARSDVFSAGVVLAEMVAPGGVHSFEDRRQVWEGIHREILELADTPWSKVVARAVAPEREERFALASGLARALEEVTLRAAGDETVRPYPGLLAYQQEDARFFFGRELEVEALLKKLRRPHLTAVIGPSGAGKSSFLRAGLLPTLTDGWRTIIATPSNRPFFNFTQALATELGDAPGAEDLLLHFEEPGIAIELLSEWSQQHEHCLVIVDQFEELFTQCSPEVQGHFAELLGQLPLEADVHVMLSMRDDFLFHCHRFEALQPILSELSLLGPPMGGSLRRAIVEPALRCGYRFEDEALVEELLSEVEGERGSLPMVAFAVARLWESRDSEQGLLTRDAYEQIGGVGGALAQNAEMILESIGKDHIPVVRELFRNLVTAQGTRAARGREELLSVFAGSTMETAEEILSTLIDARLLTSYEIATGDEGTAHHRIEIIHESLLTNWPRLVRWQMQDAEGAKIRDELRNQAQLWEQHDRSVGYLWTGTAFREFQLWRERYPGGLTTTEAEFARAMTAHAERRRRRRRLAIVAVIVLLLGVAATLASFWYRSETARQEAVAAELKAEASNLYGLARMQPEEEPAAFLAYAIASLEHGDNPEVRWEVLKALWRGPPGFRIPNGSPVTLDFSPDGRWLATANRGEEVRLWPSDGGPPKVLEGSSGYEPYTLRISPKADVVAHTRLTDEASSPDQDWREVLLWSFPSGRFLRTLEFDEGNTRYFSFSSDGERLFTVTRLGRQGEGGVTEVRSWPVAGGDPDLLARLDLPGGSPGWPPVAVDPTGSRLAWAEGSTVHIAPVEGTTLHRESATTIPHERPVDWFWFDGQGQQLATDDSDGTMRIWSLENDPPELIRSVSGKGELWRFDTPGLTRAVSTAGLWDLKSPPDAEPLPLLCASNLFENDDCFYGVAFHPQGEWIAVGNLESVSLWPLGRQYPHVLEGHEGGVQSVEFTPDGRWFISAGRRDRTVRVWPLESRSGEGSRIVYEIEEAWGDVQHLALSRSGTLVAIGTFRGKVAVFPFEGGPARELSGFTDRITALEVGPNDRFVAAGSGYVNKEESLVRVWDLESGEVHILDVGNPDRFWINPVRFTSDGELLVPSDKYRRWDLGGVTPRLLTENELGVFNGVVRDFSTDGRLALIAGWGKLFLEDVEAGTSRELSSHGQKTNRAVFDPTDKIVVSADGKSGAIHVGLASGGETHLLLGHEMVGSEGLIGLDALAVSPDGQWIASGGNDGTIRLWPMPDMSQPPFHTLPRDELVAKLRTLTNLRVVEDPDSPSGWKLEIGPFPGWQEVPTW